MAKPRSCDAPFAHHDLFAPATSVLDFPWPPSSPRAVDLDPWIRQRKSRETCSPDHTPWKINMEPTN